MAKRKASNPMENRGKKKKDIPVKASKKVEALPVYKEYKSTNLKVITFSDFRIDATVSFNESLLHNFFDKAKVNGYYFFYKGLHLSADNIDSKKAKKISYMFTSIELRVPVNYLISKIKKDLTRSSERVCGVRTIAEIVFKEVYEDIGL